MKTYEEQERFFQGRKAELMGAFSAAGGGVAGAKALVNTVMAEAGALERRVLFAFVRGMLTFEVVGRDGLDVIITVADAGIAENMRQFEAEVDPAVKNKRLDSAIPMSYNLAADLAGCWEDQFNRQRRHYERGLAAGEFCLKWRQWQGNPTAQRMAMCHWVCGVHRLALADAEGARADLEKSLAFECQAAGLTGEVVVDEKLPDGVLLSRGWLAVMDGDEGLLEQLANIFEERMKSSDEHVKGAAKWTLIQLRAGWKLWEARKSS
jgi:hypothetical protein